MRLPMLAVTLALGLGACANQYSDVPEPTGEWGPVNPPGIATAFAPEPVLHKPMPVRHRTVRPVRRQPTVAAQ